MVGFGWINEGGGSRIVGMFQKFTYLTIALDEMWTSTSVLNVLTFDAMDGWIYIVNHENFH